MFIFIYIRVRLILPILCVKLFLHKNQYKRLAGCEEECFLVCILKLNVTDIASIRCSYRVVKNVAFGRHQFDKAIKSSLRQVQYYTLNWMILYNKTDFYWTYYVILRIVFLTICLLCMHIEYWFNFMCMNQSWATDMINSILHTINTITTSSNYENVKVVEQ